MANRDLGASGDLGGGADVGARADLGGTRDRGSERRSGLDDAGCLGDAAGDDDGSARAVDDGGADDALLAAVSARFADRAATVLPRWMAERAMAVLQSAGLSEATVAAAADEVRRQGNAAGRRAADALRQLVHTDIERQRSTPLAVVRAAVGDLSETLHQVGVAAPVRQEALVRAAPEDSFSLAPSSWSEVDPDLAEAALTWGAAKAALHLRRHRSPASGEDPSRSTAASERRFDIEPGPAAS